MYHDILVHVEGGAVGRERVRFAIDLAKRLGASLSGFHMTPPAEVPPVYKPSVHSAVIGKITDKLAQDARNAAAIFDEETSQLSIKASWSQSSGDIAKGVCRQARYADLVILGRDERQNPPERHPFPIAHSVALRCGRPVLVLPDVPPMAKFDRVVVAWDGGREAVRALHDALPLLSLSSSVQVVRILKRQDEESDLDAKHLSAHLHNHGINIGSGVIQITSEKEHEALMEQIDAGDFDLLVMGAYSYPMWLELIVGGATPSILSSSKIPVLVSH